MKILKLKKGDINVFKKSLNVSLPFERSKARNEFVKEFLEPAGKEVETKRLEIIGKYCKKDSEGKNLVLPNGFFDFEPEGMEKANEEFNTLQMEEVEISVSEHILKNLKIIKNIITSSEKELEPQESVSLVRIIDAIDLITI